MKEIEIDDWEQFKTYISDNFGGVPGYIFRGHSDRSWKLESTLTRLANKLFIKDKISFIETVQLDNFKKKIRGLKNFNTTSLDNNELWALGQHYGLSTPLLDWTESPFIATYFAFENAESCNSGWRTIFALNKNFILSKIKDELQNELEFFESFLDNNNRIIAQAGLFTKIPTGIDLEKWLDDNNLLCHLTKIHIDNELRLEAINDLALMNIVSSTIYPDFHGASISCNMWLEALSNNYELSLLSQDLYQKIISDEN